MSVSSLLMESISQGRVRIVLMLSGTGRKSGKPDLHDGPIDQHEYSMRKGQPETAYPFG